LFICYKFNNNLQDYQGFMSKIKQNTNPAYKITVDGSLGLLALGDLGFRAWREIKNKADKKNMIDEEE
jgi:hypothetical protein